MIIANIVTDFKYNYPEEYNVVKSLDEITNNLPTLIVGFKKVKNIYPEFDILTKKIKNNIYWTFNRIERRDDFEIDLDSFKNYVLTNLFNDIPYIYVDIFNLQNKNIKKIINIINKSDNIITLKHDNMLYLYNMKYIFGINLNIVNFVGLDSNKVLSKIKLKSDVFLEYDDIFDEYKNIMYNIYDNIRYIPFLFKLKNEKDLVAV